MTSGHGNNYYIKSFIIDKHFFFETDFEKQKGEIIYVLMAKADNERKSIFFSAT